MSIAFLCPGQGSQSVGMGKDYLEAEPRARERFAEASGILGYDLAQLCLEGPAERLNLTLHTQPAIFTQSSLVIDLLSDRGVRPDFVAGHSVGEFAALYAAGALAFEPALRALARRAELMHKAGGGAMSAVLNLPSAEVVKVCEQIDGVVVVANDNSPKQVVISGDPAAVAAAEPLLKAAGARRVVALPVSGAFHSPLMEPARGPFVETLREAPWQAPACTFVANADAAPHGDPAQFPELVGGQLTRGVQWTKTIDFLLANGVDVLIETGPGRVLGGLMRAWEGDFKVASTDTPAALEEAAALANA